MEFKKIKCIDDLCAYLGMTFKELKYVIENKNKKYKCYIKKKKNGGKRKISIPDRQLKYIQYMLKKGFDNFYYSNNNNDFVHGFLNEKSIVTNAKEHVGKNYILNIDIKNFFPSITTKRVYGVLKSFMGFDLSSDVADIIANLVTYKNELPQGAPTSPVISNIICHNLDIYFKKWMKRHPNFIYTRYADDISISTNNKDELYLIFQNNKLNEHLEKVFSKNGFEINHDKTRLQCKCCHQEVTGIKVNEKLNLSRHYIYRLRSMIHSWEKYGLDNAYKVYCDKKNIKYDTGNKYHYVSAVIGMLSYYKMVKGLDDNYYIKLAERVNALLGKCSVPYKANYENIKRKSVYQLTTNSEIGMGTCFKIRNYIVTCLHCLYDSKPYDEFKRFNIYLGGRVIIRNAEPIYVSENHDLALFDASKVYDYPYIIISDEEVVNTEEVRVLGYPMSDIGDNISEQNVQVIGKQYIELKNIIKDNYYIVVGAIQLGNSGGPVLNKKNELVGMVCLGSDSSDANFKNGFLSAQVIKSEIELYEKSHS